MCEAKRPTLPVRYDSCQAILAFSIVDYPHPVLTGGFSGPFWPFVAANSIFSMVIYFVGCVSTFEDQRPSVTIEYESCQAAVVFFNHW